MRAYFISALLSCGMALTAALPATAQQNKPVVVGVLNDMVGPYSAISGPGSAIAAEMAAEDFGGSVLGRPIKVISADHQNKPDVGSAIARRWFDTEDVQLILDLPTSGVALAVQGVGREKGKITIISTGGPELATGAQCSPTGIHWVYDTYSAGKTIALANQTKPGTKWFFIVLDSVAGEFLLKATTRFVEPMGGKIVGVVKHPLNSGDMSSYLLQAQASGADIIAVGNAGADLVTTLKQAQEFGLKQKLVSISTYISDIQAMGLEIANGISYATAFFPDQSPEAKAWSDRFQKKAGAPPTDGQAGVYSALTHYLKAVQASGTLDSRAVMQKMRDIRVKDMFTNDGFLRIDGRMVHDTFLVSAKSPKESTGPFDLVKLATVIPADQAFRPLSESECPIVKASGK